MKPGTTLSSLKFFQNVSSSNFIFTTFDDLFYQNNSQYFFKPHSIFPITQLCNISWFFCVFLKTLTFSDSKDSRFIFQIIKNENLSFLFLDLPSLKITSYNKFFTIKEITHNNTCSFIITRQVNLLKSASLCNFKTITLSSHLTNWKTAAAEILFPKRSAVVHRTSNETSVSVSLTLEGVGKALVRTGLSFFDHMLEQLIKHSGVDCHITVKGDLHIDEHHTVEDCAIVLGEAFKQALGNKSGIQRFGFFLPMDESISRCALDFSGRPELIFSAHFDREKVGDLPTELVQHFFQSLCFSAGINLFLEIKGRNNHHMIESAFKCVAKALQQAIRIHCDYLPSTKGIL